MCAALFSTKSSPPGFVTKVIQAKASTAFDVTSLDYFKLEKAHVVGPRVLQPGARLVLE